MSLGVITVLGSLIAFAISGLEPANSPANLELIIFFVGIAATIYGAITSFIEAKK